MCVHTGESRRQTRREKLDRENLELETCPSIADYVQVEFLNDPLAWWRPNDGFYTAEVQKEKRLPGQETNEPKKVESNFTHYQIPEQRSSERVEHVQVVNSLYTPSSSTKCLYSNHSPFDEPREMRWRCDNHAGCVLRVCGNIRQTKSHTQLEPIDQM